MYDRAPGVHMRITSDQPCFTYGRRACCRKNQVGANLNRDGLHDELQLFVC
jgi:hypothetical protein